MPSLGDSAVIIFLGLLLFGPKGLAQIARQLGKLMGEFRRASNEFRMQMEEELRVSEQADRQKQIAAIEAAAPVPPVLTSSLEEAEIDHPHLRALTADTMTEPATDSGPVPVDHSVSQSVSQSSEMPSPVPIATAGALSIMPPSTGLPAPRSSSILPFLDAVPHVDPPNGHVDPTNGHVEAVSDGSEQRPVRYTNHRQVNHGEHATPPEAVDAANATESVHG